MFCYIEKYICNSSWKTSNSSLLGHRLKLDINISPKSLKICHTPQTYLQKFQILIDKCFGDTAHTYMYKKLSKQRNQKRIKDSLENIIAAIYSTYCIPGIMLRI